VLPGPVRNLLSLYPDYVMAHRLEPIAPELTSVEFSWYLPPSVSDATYAVEFWDRTNRRGGRAGLGRPSWSFPPPWRGAWVLARISTQEVRRNAEV
jgi:hypothetical protein